MENTKIEWATSTFNPWMGCTKVSTGCANCYAEATMDLRYHKVKWGAGQPRALTSVDNWKKPLRWNRAAVAAGAMSDPAKRPRIFCASLADVFDEEVPSRWRDRLWELIHACHALDWLILTKRPRNMAAMLPDDFLRPDDPLPWPHVWLGVTVEDQANLWRAEHLVTIPAARRFLSVEPLVGPLSFCLGQRNALLCPLCQGSASDPEKPGPCPACQDSLLGLGIHWVIVGGESGDLARPMHPDWAARVMDECSSAGVHFFFKQWGEWSPVTHVALDADGSSDLEYVASSVKPAGERKCPLRLAPACHEFPDGQRMLRVGKRAAGRCLDGIVYSGRPPSHPAALVSV